MTKEQIDPLPKPPAMDWAFIEKHKGNTLAMPQYEESACCDGGRMPCPTTDKVNHPAHYQTASGLECIDVIEALGDGLAYCRGNAIKYLWRLGKKGEALEDVRKAQWYVNRLVQQLEQA